MDTKSLSGDDKQSSSWYVERGHDATTIVIEVQDDEIDRRAHENSLADVDTGNVETSKSDEMLIDTGPSVAEPPQIEQTADVFDEQLNLNFTEFGNEAEFLNDASENVAQMTFDIE